MNAFTHRAGVAGFVACLWLAGGRTSSASSIVELSAAELVVRADMIILGDVLDTVSAWNDQRTLIVTEAAVQARVTLKGASRGVEIVQYIGGEIDGLQLRASDMPMLEPGDTVLLFINGDRNIVGSFQGAYFTDGQVAGRADAGFHAVDQSTIRPLRPFLRAIAEEAGGNAPDEAELSFAFADMPGSSRYELIGADWSYKDSPMGEEFHINPNCADASAGPVQNQISALFLGSSAWTDVEAGFEFDFGGLTASTSDSFDGTNNVFFCPSGDCDMDDATLAVTRLWISNGEDIVEWDMIFNDSEHEFWDGLTGACGGARYDIRAVATHEFGHALGLDHSDVPEATMWPSVQPCETTPRSLEDDDIDGLSIIYAGEEANEPFVFIGAAEEDRLGFAVSNAGDINNDGIEDIMVGAPYNDDGGEDAGKVYIYSGDTGTIIDSIEGAGSGYQFGYSLAHAGDVDGDGRDDIIIGAPYASDSRGRAYVYSGADRSILYTRTGKSGASERLGWSVAGNMDVNNDGYSDFIVGSPYSDEAASNAGKVRIYSGVDGDMIEEFFGARANDNYGWAVCGVGRINSDSHADFLVGAPNNDDAGSNAGKAYIYSGRHMTLLYSLEGYQDGSQFGRGASGIGLIDSDGRSDFVVGSPYYKRDDYEKAGRMDVFSGKDGAKIYSKKGELPEDRLGWSLSAAGDVDEDGVDDIIIGSPRNSSVQSTQGRVYVRNGLSGALIAQFDGEGSGDQLGVAVSGISDINGDGKNDVLMGAPYNDEGGSKAGQAYVNTSEDRVARRALDSSDAVETAATLDRRRDALRHLLRAWMEGGLLADLNGDDRVDDHDLTLILLGGQIK